MKNNTTKRLGLIFNTIKGLSTATTYIYICMLYAVELKLVQDLGVFVLKAGPRVVLTNWSKISPFSTFL